MDVSSFQTRVAAGGPARGSTTAAQDSGAPAGGLDGFLDLLLSTLRPEVQNGAAPGQPATAQEPDRFEGLIESLPENPSLDDLLDALEKAGIDDAASLAALLSQNIRSAGADARADILGMLRDILDGATPEDVAALSASLSANDNTPGPALTAGKTDLIDTLDALISSGLTPAQIAELAGKLKALRAEKGAAMDAAFLAGLLGQGQTPPAPAGQAQDSLERDVRALLAQALTASKEASPGADPAKFSDGQWMEALSRALGRKTLIGPAPEAGQDAELLLTRQGDALQKFHLSPFIGGPESLTPRTGAPSPSTGLHTGLPTPAGGDPSPLPAAGWSLDEPSFEEWMRSLTTANLSGGAGPAQSLSGPLSPGLSHLQGVNAASQVAAVAIVRAAQGGEARTLTLHLDPPELGRVAVRLEMDRNRALRTVMTIEKPETHSLLQRDAHILERALHNAGIDTSGGESLSFELAGEGFAFGDENNGRGGSDGGSGQTEPESRDILETRMDWYVDPQTGLHHYDILA